MKIRVKFFLSILFVHIIHSGLFCPAMAMTGEPQTQKLTAGAKKGWNIAPFPAVGFNSDLGLQYGAYCELYNFGNGTEYPAYRYKLCAEISQYTKGSGVYWFYFDTPYLWKNHRITFDAGWFPDRMYDFYGYNGYASPYVKNENNSFYKIDRKQLRILFNLQGKIAGKLNWMAGISWQRMMIAPVTMKKYIGKDNLYNHYIKDGLIDKNEAKGGNVVQWKTGIIYDTRDREADPTKGMFGEAIIAFAPDFIDRDGYSFIKTNFSLSYFQPIYKDRITLAARASVQYTPWGNQPFYILSNINTFYLRQTYSEGLGGSSTLRGILRNRILGNSTGLINAEIRFRTKVFKLIKQNWYIAINPFVDAGGIFQTYRKNAQKQSTDPLIYTDRPERIHVSAGIGGKIVMNHNFVLSAEWGKAFDHRDGTNGASLGLNYLF